MRESIGETIRKRRKELNLTQTEVAGTIMSIAKLSNIETGKVTPDAATLKYLQDKLHLPELYTSEFSKENISFIMEQALTYVHSGLRKQAADKLNEVQEKASKALLLGTWAEAKEQLLNLYFEQGQLDEGVDHLKELESYYRETGDTAGIIRCLLKKGYLAYHKKNYSLSIRNYEQALDLITDDFDTKRKVYYYLAAVYYDIHDIDQCSFYCDKALSEGDPMHDQYGVYMLQGMVLQKVGMFQLAKEKLRLAKKIAIETKNQMGLAKTWHNIGHLEMRLGNYTDALQCFHLSLELKMEINDLQGISRTKSFLCLLNAKQGYFDLAEESGAEALKISRQLNKELDEMTAYECLSEVYSISGKYELAIEYLLKAIGIADHFKLNSKLKDLYGEIANTYDKLGDKERCLNYLYKKMKLTNFKR